MGFYFQINLDFTIKYRLSKTEFLKIFELTVRFFKIPTDITTRNYIEFEIHVCHIFFQMLSDIFDLPERPPDTQNQPLLMNIHDDICIRTNHLKTIYGFNPQEVEKEMLKKLPFQTLLQLPRPTSSVAKDRAARLQELVHFCATGGLSQSGELY